MRLRTRGSGVRIPPGAPINQTLARCLLGKPANNPVVGAVDSMIWPPHRLMGAALVACRSLRKLAPVSLVVTGNYRATSGRCRPRAILPEADAWSHGLRESAKELLVSSMSFSALAGEVRAKLPAPPAKMASNPEAHPTPRPSRRDYRRDRRRTKHC
jgi:hypothetical protein